MEIISPDYIPVELGIKILYAANKYDIPDLINMMRTQLYSFITIDALPCLMDCCKLLDFSDLEKICWKIAAHCASKFVSSENFLDLSHDQLCKFLKRDDLNISEMKLYDGVLRYDFFILLFLSNYLKFFPLNRRWAYTHCKDFLCIEPTDENVREILADAFYDIRFPTMDAHDFINGPAEQDLFTKREILNIFQTKFSKVRPLDSLFSSDTRKCDQDTFTQSCQCVPLSHFCRFCRSRTLKAPKDSDFGQLYATISESKTMGSKGFIKGHCPCEKQHFCALRKIVTAE